MAIAVCHPNKFSKGRGLCGACYDKWLKSVNPEYRQRQVDNTSAWFRRNPEKRKAEYLKRQAKERANPLIRRATMLRRSYGITLDDYAAMLQKQNNSCALCYRKQGEKPLHVDHSHTTGKVRGLLCHQCNWYLGVVEADVTIMERIRRYLGLNTD